MKLPRRWTALALAGTGFLAALGAITAAPQAQAAAGCQVNYSVTSEWGSGFGAAVQITNLGDPLSGWRLTWAFGAGQSVTQLWNGAVDQSGSQVTVTNAAYNGSLATGASTSFGFNATRAGSNP